MDEQVPVRPSGSAGRLRGWSRSGVARRLGCTAALSCRASVCISSRPAHQVKAGIRAWPADSNHRHPTYVLCTQRLARSAVLWKSFNGLPRATKTHLVSGLQQPALKDAADHAFARHDNSHAATLSGVFCQQTPCSRFGPMSPALRHPLAERREQSTSGAVDFGTDNSGCGCSVSTPPKPPTNNPPSAVSPTPPEP